MSSWTISIQPLVGENSFGEWIDVTNYVDAQSIGDISQEIEKDDYSVGVAKNSNVSFKIKNTSGLFSDENTAGTIFKYRRSGSRVRIEYFQGDDLPICGMAICGVALLGDRITMFEGLLSGDSVGQDIGTDMISLSVLGYESLFESVEFDIATISTDVGFMTLFQNILSNSIITSRVTLDTVNWTVGVNQSLDNLTEFEDIDSIKDALDKLLLFSNSILYVEGNTLQIRSKEPTAELIHTFYGQASDVGLENIINISDFKDGTNRTFNLWRWNDKNTPYVLKDSASIQRYGLRKTEEIGGESITNTSKISAILSSYLTEYSTPKKELELTAPLTLSSAILLLMDRINIDYPVPVYPAKGGILPIWGTESMTWNEFYWPESYFNFSISSVEYFKVTGIKFSPKNDTVTLKLRSITNG